MTTTVFTRSVTSEILFGGADNPYFADPARRQIITKVVRNSHGEVIAELWSGRRLVIDAQERIIADRLVHQSPVYTSEQDANVWADLAQEWAVRRYTGQIGSGPSAPCPLLTVRHTYCVKCDRWDTVKTEQQAWGDLHTCSTEGCDLNAFASIGD